MGRRPGKGKGLESSFDSVDASPLLVNGDDAASPSPTDDGRRPDPREPQSPFPRRVAALCAFSFLFFFRPSAPLYVPFLIHSKGLSAHAVETGVLPWFTYALAACLVFVSALSHAPKLLRPMACAAPFVLGVSLALIRFGPAVDGANAGAATDAARANASVVRSAAVASLASPAPTRPFAIVLRHGPVIDAPRNAYEASSGSPWDGAPTPRPLIGSSHLPEVDPASPLHASAWRRTAGGTVWTRGPVHRDRRAGDGRGEARGDSGASAGEKVGDKVGEPTAAGDADRARVTRFFAAAEAVFACGWALEAATACIVFFLFRGGAAVRAAAGVRAAALAGTVVSAAVGQAFDSASSVPRSTAFDVAIGAQGVALLFAVFFVPSATAAVAPAQGRRGARHPCGPRSRHAEKGPPLARVHPASIDPAHQPSDPVPCSKGAARDQSFAIGMPSEHSPLSPPPLSTPPQSPRPSPTPTRSPMQSSSSSSPSSSGSPCLSAVSLSDDSPLEPSSVKTPSHSRGGAPTPSVDSPPRPSSSHSPSGPLALNASPPPSSSSSQSMLASPSRSTDGTCAGRAIPGAVGDRADDDSAVAVVVVGGNVGRVGIVDSGADIVNDIVDDRGDVVVVHGDENFSRAHAPGPVALRAAAARLWSVPRAVVRVYADTDVLRWSAWYVACRAAHSLALAYVQSLAEEIEPGNRSNAAISLACNLTGAALALAAARFPATLARGCDLALALCGASCAACLAVGARVDSVLALGVCASAMQGSLELAFPVANAAVASQRESARRSLAGRGSAASSVSGSTVVAMNTAIAVAAQVGVQILFDSGIRGLDSARGYFLCLAALVGIATVACAAPVLCVRSAVGGDGPDALGREPTEGKGHGPSSVPPVDDRLSIQSHV